MALEWPFRDLVLNMAVGFAPVGMQPDTGVWRLDPPANQPECFEKLKRDDPEWNDRLFSSIVHEGTKTGEPSHRLGGVATYSRGSASGLVFSRHWRKTRAGGAIRRAEYKAHATLWRAANRKEVSML